MTDTTSLSHLERHVVRTRGEQTALRVPLDGVHLVLKHERAMIYEKGATYFKFLQFSTPYMEKARDLLTPFLLICMV